MEIDVTHETDTRSGHVQMLTGHGPEVTGVHSNAMYGPIPKGYTVFERLKDAFGKDNIKTIMITGKALVIDLEGGPFYRARDAIDVLHVDPQRIVDGVDKLALDSLERCGGGRFFAFFHFCDPDHAGHRHGENSREYSNAIIVVDRALGRIADKLRTLGVYEDTRVYVTSDHGFGEGKTTHCAAPYVFLGTNDPEIRRRGDQRDILPTILVAIHHSDHGAQYTAMAFGRTLKEAGVLGAMGTIGDALDNALAESFFATLKTQAARPMQLAKPPGASLGHLRVHRGPVPSKASSVGPRILYSARV